MNDMRFRRHFAHREVQETLVRGLHRARVLSEDLWKRGKRHPRALAISGGVLVVTLAGAYAVSASGPGQSVCPPATEGRKPQFVVLVDPVQRAAAGSEVKIHYDVCGLREGTAYRGRIQLSPQAAGAKKIAARRKPLVVTFRDQVDGPATRRREELNLGSTKPGAYSLELSITDNQGRERKKVQKLIIKAD
jgi:hypothetical protein